MLTAYLTADREALFSVFTDPDKLYMAARTRIFCVAIVLIFGPGKWCVDTLIAMKWGKAARGSPDQRD